MAIGPDELRNHALVSQEEKASKLADVLEPMIDRELKRTPASTLRNNLEVEVQLDVSDVDAWRDEFPEDLDGDAEDSLTNAIGEELERRYRKATWEKVAWDGNGPDWTFTFTRRP